MTALSSYSIRRAQPHELTALQDLEMRAGELFRTIGMPDVAAASPIALSMLRSAQAAGQVWVLVDTQDYPVGFAVLLVHDAVAHLEEISVDPTHGGRGLGRRLLDHVCTQAQAAGCTAVTLSTFRDVPWNSPFYSRAGFSTLDPATLPPALQQVSAREAAVGLDISKRVCMRKQLRRVPQ